MFLLVPFLQNHWDPTDFNLSTVCGQGEFWSDDVMVWGGEILETEEGSMSDHSGVQICIKSNPAAIPRPTRKE